MKYVKPVAEIVIIENEDILVDSEDCTSKTYRSASCKNNAVANMPDDWCITNNKITNFCLVGNWWNSMCTVVAGGNSL